MKVPHSISFYLSVALSLFASSTFRVQGAYYDDGAAAADDGDDQYYAAAADDGGNGYYQDDDDDAANKALYGDDYIKYWQEYAVLPKKCISYGNTDMIVFSIFEKAYQHCTDKPIGTYMTDVSTFVAAYLDQLELNSYEAESDDYVAPDSTYVDCYPYETNNGVYYVKLGCTDGTSQSLSVNVYKDNTCTESDRNADGMDDTTLDASDLQIPFKQCQSCIYFVDKNEDDVDDQYFENKMTTAPLCSTIWYNKSKCDGKCKRLGNEGGAGWTTSDKVLLVVLSAFSATMFGVILMKRQKMSNKDALLEQAALSAAGLQQTHIIGIFVLILLVIVMFGLLGLKSITWGMLLLLSTTLFAYLMKLTVDSGLNSALVADGDSSDSDDDDEEEDDEEGEYKPPVPEPATPSMPPIPPIS